MKSLKLFLVFACSSFTIFAQNNINLHSITHNREPGGGGQYSLDGTWMVNSRAKLVDTTNFGMSGTYKKTINITEGYDYNPSLESILNVPDIDIFFFPVFHRNDPNMDQFSEGELDSLYEWSLRGGKMIITNNSIPWHGNNYSGYLNSRWGFGLEQAYPTTINMTSEGAQTKLFNGPFGSLTQANLGGTDQGRFTTYPEDIVVYGEDTAGYPVVYLDCKTLDLILADIDIFTTLGGISQGTGISNNNDMLWMNTIAFMDSLQGPPEVLLNGTTLSTTDSYPEYQWFYYGDTIPLATADTFALTQYGSYTVKVYLDCGCYAESKPFIYAGACEDSTINTGMVTASDSLVCVGDIVDLSLPNNIYAYGQTFQWQVSFDNLTWTNLNGFVNSTASVQVDYPAYYRCQVNCNQSVESESVFIDIDTPFNCMCTTETNPHLGDHITYVGISDLSSYTGDVFPEYGYSFTETTAELARGTVHDVTVGLDSGAVVWGGIYYVGIWMDYNHDFVFDTSEFTFIGNTLQDTSGLGLDTIVNGSLTIPSNALLGPTIVRVRNFWNYQITEFDACWSALGLVCEVEDYLVNITEATGANEHFSINNNNFIEVYPNPTKDWLTVSCDFNAPQNIQITIVNSVGQVVYTNKIQNAIGDQSPIDLSKMASGLYTVNVNSDTWENNLKIVVQ